MITSEGPDKHNEYINLGEGFSKTVSQNGNGGVNIRDNMLTNFVSNDKRGKMPSYNVGFGSTMPTAAWVRWTAAQHEVAGLSTEGFDPNDPKQTKVVQIDVPAANLWTVNQYADTVEPIHDAERRNNNFFELYERADERKARHDALRAQGLKPPFPRADRFIENKHQSYVNRAGLTTSPHYKG